MDPLGFALENFNGVGRWRTMSEAGTPVDASGALPNGIKFDGPAELRTVLLSHPEQFAHTVTDRLLTYALGRGWSITISRPSARSRAKPRPATINGRR